MTAKTFQREKDAREQQLASSMKNSCLLQEKNMSTTQITTLNRHQLRKSTLYQGQLAYLKEFLLKEHPEIDEITLAERLDVSPEIAKLLLTDATQK